MIKNTHVAFVGATEGAKLLGISRSGFLKFVSSGALPTPWRLGRRLLWDPQELISRVKGANDQTGGSQPEISPRETT